MSAAASARRRGHAAVRAVVAVDAQTRVATTQRSPRTVEVMSQYMAWPTADGVWHIGTGLTLPRGAGLADLNKLLTLRHIDRAQIGFHRPNDEARFNEQFATPMDPGQR